MFYDLNANNVGGKSAMPPVTWDPNRLGNGAWIKKDTTSPSIFGEKANKAAQNANADSVETYPIETIKPKGTKEIEIEGEKFVIENGSEIIIKYPLKITERGEFIYGRRYVDHSDTDPKSTNPKSKYLREVSVDKAMPMSEDVIISNFMKNHPDVKRSQISYSNGVIEVRYK